MQVRLRWPGPLRQTTEITETLDVSRGGLLVYSADGPHPGRPLWLTFPYENSMTVVEPEILAHVLRVERRPAGGSFLAIRFDPSAVAIVAEKPIIERRFLPRTVIGVPISVRLPSSPWPEETMTRDLSADGLSFITPRVYNLGDTLKVAMALGVTPTGWASRGEISGRVVRVTPAPRVSASAASESPVSPLGSPVSSNGSSQSRPNGSTVSGHSPSQTRPAAVSSASVSNEQLVALRRLP